jgi:hypothetical protein
MRPVADSFDLSPDRRLHAVAEILARGIRRHLAITQASSQFSAVRTSEISPDSIPSALAIPPDKSVTVLAGQLSGESNSPGDSDVIGQWERNGGLGAARDRQAVERNAEVFGVPTASLEG